MLNWAYSVLKLCLVFTTVRHLQAEFEGFQGDSDKHEANGDSLPPARPAYKGAHDGRTDDPGAV